MAIPISAGDDDGPYISLYSRSERQPRPRIQLKTSGAVRIAGPKSDCLRAGEVGEAEEREHRRGQHRGRPLEPRDERHTAG